MGSATEMKGGDRGSQVTDFDGLQWSCKLAKVADVFSFQDSDTGRPIAGVKLHWFGGQATIMVEPDGADSFRKYIGKVVECSGSLEFDPAKKKAKFHISVIAEKK